MALVVSAARGSFRWFAAQWSRWRGLGTKKEIDNQLDQYEQMATEIVYGENISKRDLYDFQTKTLSMVKEFKFSRNQRNRMDKIKQQVIDKVKVGDQSEQRMAKRLESDQMQPHQRTGYFSSRYRNGERNRGYNAPRSLNEVLDDERRSIREDERPYDITAQARELLALQQSIQHRAETLTRTQEEAWRQHRQAAQDVFAVPASSVLYGFEIS